MKRIKIKFSSIIIPLLVIILLFALTIFLIIMPYIRKSFIEKETENIKFLVESQIQVLETLNRSAENGRITIKHAKEEALSIIKDQRYGPRKDFYFWIIDMEPVLLMHPFQKELENTYVGDYKDADGNNLFQHMVDIVSEKGEGYLEYLWELPYSGGTVLAKKSYVQLYEPWGWIIGTGFYIQKLSLEIRSLFIVITIFSVIVLLLITTISIYLFRQRLKLSNQNYNFKQNLFESERRYYELLNSMNDGFLLMDEDNKIKLANRKLCSWIGLDDIDVLGTDVSEYIDPGFLKVLYENIRLRKSGQNDQYEIVINGKQGGKVNVVVSPRGLFDANGKYSGSFAVITDISLFKNIQRQLEGSLNQKEILIKELHHRVKNNLQIIISLLNFQKNSEIADECSNLILRLESRLYAMAIVHEIMYETDNFQSISLKGYIQRLLDYFIAETGVPTEQFSLSGDLSDISVPVDKATTIGLIFTGLQIRMVQLFKEYEGRTLAVNIKMNLSLMKDRWIMEYSYSHDGKTPPPEEPEDDIELILLKNLAMQLHGEFFYSKQTESVVSCSIDIPISEFKNPE